ncbi:MAG: hypothetical protein GY869_25405, partial [Planctomycetes bacterium]|nr:hypothetical protein [Planctomycetota bacterium]
GIFQWVSDGEEAAQHAWQRLFVFQGELSLDGVLTEKTLEGTKWYGIIFDMSKPQSEKELEIKRRILGPGINRFSQFSWTQVDHTVTVTGFVVTDWGTVDITQTFAP